MFHLLLSFVVAYYGIMAMNFLIVLGAMIVRSGFRSVFAYEYRNLIRNLRSSTNGRALF